MTTLQLRKSIDRSPLRQGFLLIPLMLACFALSPTAFAVTPAPDGGYPNQNTAEGENALFSLTGGTHNTAVGGSALFSLMLGTDNTAVGANALYNNTGCNCAQSEGSYNTAVGSVALFSNTGGYMNTATGTSALGYNTGGKLNTATGMSALQSNTTGNYNTANGAFAMSNNNNSNYNTGSNNTATGYSALFSNTTGYDNTANGSGALYSNTTGNNNSASGVNALHGNRGNNNTANGANALYNNSTGSYNTATGNNALQANTNGIKNTANGYLALAVNTNGNGNTAEGLGALQNNTGSFNTAVGFNAGASITTGSNNLDILAPGVAGESNTMRIGTGKQKATYITGINGVTVANGVGVIIDSTGHLGTVQSSARFKEAIEPMDKVSEAILALKPVSFRYKTELDSKGVRQFGLIAEEVEKVNPDLVVRDKDGEIYTVRYEAVNAMLLNEFLKEHRKVEEQQATISKLESKVANEELIATQQQKQIEALTTTVQKVSDQVALSKPAAQLVANP